MASFALLMKARANACCLFTFTDKAGNSTPPRLNVLSLKDNKCMNVDELAILVSLED